MLQFDEIAKNNKIKIYNKYATYYPNLLKKFSKKIFSSTANIKIGKTFEPKINFVSPLKTEIFHFFECVKNRKKPMTDGLYAKNISQVIEKIEKKIN